jgi:hypothetical protein
MGERCFYRVYGGCRRRVRGGVGGWGVADGGWGGGDRGGGCGRVRSMEVGGVFVVVVRHVQLS